MDTKTTQLLRHDISSTGTDLSASVMMSLDGDGRVMIAKLGQPAFSVPLAEIDAFAALIEHVRDLRTTQQLQHLAESDEG